MKKVAINMRLESKACTESGYKDHEETCLEQAAGKPVGQG